MANVNPETFQISVSQNCQDAEAQTTETRSILGNITGTTSTINFHTHMVLLLNYSAHKLEIVFSFNF